MAIWKWYNFFWRIRKLKKIYTSQTHLNEFLFTMQLFILILRYSGSVKVQ